MFKSLFLKWMNNQKCLSGFTFWEFWNNNILWFAGPGTQKLWRREQASGNFSRQIRWTCWRKPPARVKVALNFGKLGLITRQRVRLRGLLNSLAKSWQVIKDRKMVSCKVWGPGNSLFLAEGSSELLGESRFLYGWKAWTKGFWQICTTEVSSVRKCAVDAGVVGISCTL